MHIKNFLQTHAKQEEGVPRRPLLQLCGNSFGQRMTKLTQLPYKHCTEVKQ